MNYETLYSPAHLRHRVWVKISDLTAGASDGTYTLNDTDIANMLGDGSEIIVIDQPGMLLFWSATDKLGYQWGSGV